MSNDANIGLNSNEDNTALQVYTHHDGTEAPNLLANALDRGRSRWDDHAYLNRIIISEFIKKAGVDETTGVGISAAGLHGPDDITVNMDEQTVTLHHLSKTVEYDEYIALANTVTRYR